MIRFLFCILLWAQIFPAFSATEKETAVAQTRFLALADIHFDPFITCGLARPCPLIEQLRLAPAGEWAQVLTEYDNASQQYGNDTGFSLLISSLAAAKHSAKANQAQFILILGDVLGHDYKRYYKTYSADKHLDGYQDFVRKTLEFLSGEWKRAFPDLDIYFVAGNNDSYKGDYVSSPGGPFFRDVANIGSGLIKNANNRAAMRSQFAAAGYYAVDLPQPSNTRLIVLNTNLFSYKARGKGVSRAARQELVWLHDQLEYAKDKNKKVFIAMHIPEGIDVSRSARIQLFRLLELWHGNNTQRFQSEVRAYAPQIAGIFAGHLHSDWFHILVFDDKNEVPVIGVPSISPIFGNNPGFKVFTYSNSARKIEDFVTYYYPLNTKRAWGMGYDFNQITKPDCHPCPSIASMDSLNRGGSAAHFYRLFYSVNVNSQPIPTKWPPYYWCAIDEINVENDKICVE